MKDINLLTIYDGWHCFREPDTERGNNITITGIYSEERKQMYRDKADMILDITDVPWKATISDSIPSGFDKYKNKKRAIIYMLYGAVIIKNLKQ